MAQMPRGQPRSVPDPAGEQYDEMIRQERLKRQRAEAAASRPPSSLDPDLHPALFSPFERRFDFGNPRLDPTVRIGDQRYREVDNGRAGVLVPDSMASPAELAEQRRAVERVAFMADHPLAGVAYGLATLANASPRVRDQALVAGGVADTAMLGAAPRAGSVRSPTPPPQGQPAPPTLQRPNTRYRDLNASGQATGVNVTLTAPMLGTGTRARRNPPGWQGHGKEFNEARGHLHARDHGGSGGDMRNIVTLTHNGANTPQMQNFERGVTRRVRAGEVVEYSVTPLYNDGVIPPSAILMTAYGSRGAPTARVVQNPAGRRR